VARLEVEPSSGRVGDGEWKNFRPWGGVAFGLGAIKSGASKARGGPNDVFFDGRPLMGCLALV
jgi:hypothetical protein